VRDEEVAMVEVIVERSFEEPMEFAAIQAIEDRGAWCLEEHRVRFVRTYFSKDRRRMICLYEAPDADSVRIAQQKAGMPLDRVWSATRNPAPAGWPGPPPGPRENVIVERSFDEPITPEAIAALFEKGEECLPRHQIAYLGGHIASDGRRMICVFVAPDAESVRIANRQSGVRFDRVWTATLHEPSRPA
jgi:uncharacterized protein DUF4242